jgi:uncharacterized protein (DUF4415 family)
MKTPKTLATPDFSKTFQALDLEKVAQAIEADAGESLPGLRESLVEAKAGVAGRVTTAEQIAARRRGRPVGSTAAVTKHAVTLRLAPDVLARWRASGKGWQTRAAEALAEKAPT